MDQAQVSQISLSQPPQSRMMFLKENALAIFLTLFVTLITLGMTWYIIKSPNLLKPFPGSCKILQEHYCSEAKLIEIKTPQGSFAKFIGFNLPPTTPIFSSVDGMVGKTQINQPATFKGFLATTTNPSDPLNVNFIFRGDLVFNTLLSSQIKKEDLIGHIGNRNITNFGDYNLILEISQADIGNKRVVAAEQVIFKLFPYLKQ